MATVPGSGVEGTGPDGAAIAHAQLTIMQDIIIKTLLILFTVIVSFGQHESHSIASWNELSDVLYYRPLENCLYIKCKQDICQKVKFPKIIYITWYLCLNRILILSETQNSR